MTHTITKEQFTRELAEQIRVLAQKSWDECSEIKKDICSFHGERGFQIKPDIDQYMVLEEQGSLLAMTVRGNEGDLRGYSLSILYRSLHHAPVRCANVDTLYVEPEQRSYVIGLISRMEDEFRSRGIVVVGWPTSPDGELFRVLQSLGYAPDDVVMEKRICALPLP